MGEERVEVLVLMDEARNYYLIAREALERSRVTGEQRTAVEQALNGDTSGYLLIAPAAGPDTVRFPGANALFAPLGALTVSTAALDGLGVATTIDHASSQDDIAGRRPNLAAWGEEADSHGAGKRGARHP
jgi:hypothetical protein